MKPKPSNSPKEDYFVTQLHPDPVLPEKKSSSTSIARQSLFQPSENYH